MKADPKKKPSISVFEKVRPAETTVDSAYQRNFDEIRAQEMADAFDANMVGTPVLSRRSDGSLVRIDGQHRLQAKIMAGLGAEPTLCQVITGLSQSEEATLYLRLNGSRKAIRAIDKFKARVVAREPVALQIVEILKEHGLRVTAASMKHGICAVDALDSVFHKGNLGRTVAVLGEWMDGAPAAFDGKLIRAMSYFLSRYGDSIDGSILAARIQNHAPMKVLARVKQYQSGNDFKPSDAACLVLRDIYNERLAKKKQLPHPSQAQLREVEAA